MDTIEFLRKIWTWNVKRDHYVFLCSKQGKEFKTARWRDHAIKFTEGWEEKVEELLARGYDNYYFCPNGFNQARRSEACAVPGRMLWSDADNADPRKGQIKPTVLIQSSPNRYAALWHLDRRLDPEQLLKVNRELTYSIAADKGGWDYGQVLRLPGTTNGKYKTRPVVKVISFTANPIEPPQDVTTRIYEKYKSKLSAETKRKINAKSVIPGHRSDQLWHLEHELKRIGMKPQEIIALLKNTAWNKYKGRRDEDERFEAEIMKVFENDARSVVDEDEENKPKRVRKYEEDVIRMDEVEAEPVSWLWYPYIPRGKLTILEGDPSMGKSWITFALASHVSLRKRFPGQKEKPRPGRVLLMSAEDGLADTVRPRLNSLGANVKKIFAYTKPLTLDEDGIDELETQIQEIQPTLIIIDPLVAYMSGAIDLHRANQVREFTARIADMAERHNLSILAVRHLTKGGRDKAIYRGIGSIDLTAAARSVLHTGQDPEDEDTRAIVHIKSNLAPKGPSIGYRLKPGSSRPFEWAGTSRLQAHDLVQADKDMKPGEKQQQAMDFLKSKLASGKAVKFSTILRDAEAKGISRSTLKRARASFGNIEAEKIDGEWVWHMERD